MSKGRIVLETREMKIRFPQFKLVSLHNGQSGYVGRLRTKSKNVYLVLLIYAKKHPHATPKAYIIHPRIVSTKHQFSDGSICCHLPNEWRTDYTICVLVGWVAHWLHAYEEYRRTGHWMTGM